MAGSSTPSISSSAGLDRPAVESEAPRVDEEERPPRRDLSEPEPSPALGGRWDRCARRAQNPDRRAGDRSVAAVEDPAFDGREAFRSFGLEDPGRGLPIGVDDHAVDGNRRGPVISRNEGGVTDD